MTFDETEPGTFDAGPKTLADVVIASVLGTLVLVCLLMAGLSWMGVL